MGQKKRIKNKENIQPIKKTTIQQINYTQQIHMPTFNTIDLKNFAKSIDLKKQIPIKKSVSRKSRCISVKQTCTSVKPIPTPSIKYKQLLKRFEQLKGLQQKGERSRSKSAKSIRQCSKVRSSMQNIKYKLNSKKLNIPALMSKTLNKLNLSKTECNSRMSLTNKLQKTLKKLNKNDYFDNDQEDSLIRFVSTSDIGNNQQFSKNKSIEISNNMFIDQDQINILQLRKYCKTLQSQQFLQKAFKKDINYFKGDRYQMMATKIQRAWRKYRTKKLVDRYAKIFHYNFEGEPEEYMEHELQNFSSQQRANTLRFEEQELSKLQQNDQYEMNGQNQNPFLNKSFQQSEDQEISKNINKQKFDKNNIQSIFNNSQSFQKSDLTSSIQSNDMIRGQQIFETQKFYPQKVQKEEKLITYISNLQEEQEQEIQNDIKFQGQNKISSKQKEESDQYKYRNENKRGKIQIENCLEQVKQKDKERNKKNEKCENNNSGDYETMISQIKRVELEKWKQIILLLQQSKKNHNPLQIQKILNQLELRSEQNKKSLENIKKDKPNSASPQSNSQTSFLKPLITSQHQSVSVFNNKKVQTSKRNQQFIFPSRIDNKKIQQKVFEDRYKKREQSRQNEQQKLKRKKQSSGPSQSSDFKKEEQFDSRKYIEYLDSDMFLIDKDKSSQGSQLIHDQILGKKISKRKQKQLLAGLTFEDVPIKLNSHHPSKSQNLSYLINDTSPFLPQINHRLNKSISQKSLKKVIKSISPQLQLIKQDQPLDQLNLDLIRQEFLQNADPIEQLQKLHTNAELKMKIKESLQSDYNNIMNIDSDQEHTPPCRINLDLDKTFNIAPQNNENKIQSRQLNVYQKNSTNKVIVIQNIDKNIEEENQYNLQQGQQQEKQKLQNLCVMIYNTLILQVLREIAVYDPILQKFKQYSLSVRTQQKQGKKGFQTNHTEVKNYVDGLVTFLLNQQPQVFKNLQIAAGPSALQMLHYMHPNQFDQSMEQDSNNSQDETSVMVIPNRMFDKYWQIKQKTLKFQMQSDNNSNFQRKRKNLDYLKSLTKVFYRSIFDTFNECLDIERNFGQTGKPYPWKRTSNFHHVKTLNQIQKSIMSSQKRINEIATTYCGLIIQKNEMARISLQGSDDYIQHVQQDRMSRMLAQDLLEGEERWTFYDDQQLELLVEISNYITISMILQAGEEIKQIMSAKD